MGKPAIGAAVAAVAGYGVWKSCQEPKSSGSKDSPEMYDTRKYRSGKPKGKRKRNGSFNTTILTICLVLLAIGVLASIVWCCCVKSKAVPCPFDEELHQLEAG